MTVHRAFASDFIEADCADGLTMELLRRLKAEQYRFVPPTPATHQRVLDARDGRVAKTARDILGWSLPFSETCGLSSIPEALVAADLVERCEGLSRATVRVASLGEHLFLHSAFPTQAEDAVFFGPDTYRFAGLLEEALTGARAECLVEIGTGSGAGAVVAARACQPRRLIATDLNPRALDLARVNFLAAGVQAELRLGGGLAPVIETPDVIIANPPYIAGSSGRTYRDGGDMHGARLSLDWALAGSEKLAPGGRFILYTGAAIVEGRDGLKEALESRLDPTRFRLAYRELDPDVFGEEIGLGAYRDVERIAAVGAIITRCP